MALAKSCIHCIR